MTCKRQGIVCTPWITPADLQAWLHQEDADGGQRMPTQNPSMHGAAPTVYDREVMPSSAVTTMGTSSALPGSSPTMTAMGQKLLWSLQAAQHQRCLPAVAGAGGARPASQPFALLSWQCMTPAVRWPGSWRWSDHHAAWVS